MSAQNNMQGENLEKQVSALRGSLKARQDTSQGDRDRIERKIEVTNARIESVAVLAQANNTSLMVMEQAVMHTSTAVEKLASKMGELIAAMQTNEVATARRVIKFEDVVEHLDGNERTGKRGLLARVEAIEMSRAKDRSFFLGIVSVSTLVTPILTVVLAKWAENFLHLG